MLLDVSFLLFLSSPFTEAIHCLNTSDDLYYFPVECPSEAKYCLNVARIERRVSESAVQGILIESKECDEHRICEHMRKSPLFNHKINEDDHYNRTGCVVTPHLRTEYFVVLDLATTLLISTLLVLSLERLLHTHHKCLPGSTTLSAITGILCVLIRVLDSTWYSIESLTTAPTVAFLTVSTSIMPIFLSTFITAAVGVLFATQVFGLHIESSFASKLNNAAAFDAFVTPLLVIIRHEHFKTMSAERINSEIHLEALGKEQNFKQLQKDWKSKI